MQHNIAETIGRLRRERGLTQEGLGAMLGISGQAVSKWEKGESMPDILLLPELCGILGISVGAMLGQSQEAEDSDVMRAFVEMARRRGRGKTLHEAMMRLCGESGEPLPGQNVVWGKNTVRVTESGGMGFLLQSGSYADGCLAQDPEDAAYFLRALTDAGSLAVLRCITIDKAVTDEEIRERTGLDADAADRILLALMKRNIIACAVDDGGKRGYLQSAGMIGVLMALAGCRTVGSLGEPCGNFWSSRRDIPY